MEYEIYEYNDYLDTTVVVSYAETEEEAREIAKSYGNNYWYRKVEWYD